MDDDIIDLDSLDEDDFDSCTCVEVPCIDHNCPCKVCHYEDIF